MQQRGQGLIDQKAQSHIQQALEQGKGGVEGDQAAQQPVDGGQGKGRTRPGEQSVEGLDDLLIHTDDHVDWQELGVDRIGDEVIHRNTAQRHDERSNQRTGQEVMMPTTQEGLLELDMQIVVPAFITSELKRAFTMGFLIYIPFLIIDMVVSSTLMSMGMVMLPPSMISLPFKIMMFVLVDGWGLTISTLVTGFH